jgi:MoxR-like ATPase
VQNLAHLFTDAAALRAHLDRATARPGVVSPPAAMLAGASPAPLAPPVVVAPPVVAPPGGGAASLFKGWQYPVVVEAMGRGRHLLFVGPTGSGKTFCFQEAVRLTNQPCELVEGYEGLEDLDFVGAIVPQPPRLEEVGGNLVVIPESKCWVDGPVARAMRRALIEQRRVYLFVDELNRIQTRKLAVLTGLLNPIPAAVLRAAGVAPAVDAAEYYVLPIHLTGERIAVPVDWFAVAGACNMGRQYAVNDLDPALLSRLTLKLEFAYLGEADEVALVVERTGRPLAMAQVMVRTAAETRRLCGLGELPGEVDTRVLLDWAREARGADLDALWQAAAITWLAGVAGRDLRGQVLDGNAQAIRDILADRLGVGTTI